MDMPSEPPESNFKDKVTLKAYRTLERNGVIWTYMGPEQASPPPLPNLEWNLVPESHCYLTKRIAQNNYFQTIEGEIDSSHSGFLHSSFADPFRLNSKQEPGDGLQDAGPPSPLPGKGHGLWRAHRRTPQC